MHKDRIDLADLIRQSTQLARSRYHLYEHSLRYDENLNGERPMVLGMRRTAGVMANLLATPSSILSEVRVQWSFSNRDRQVLVQVRDSGLGIPGDQLKRVFKRFYACQGDGACQRHRAWPVHCSVCHQETRGPRASRECRRRAGERFIIQFTTECDELCSDVETNSIWPRLRFNLNGRLRREVVGDGETDWSTSRPQPLGRGVWMSCFPESTDYRAAELRKAGQFVPVLMLTAMGRAEDVLRGFEAGADDYLPKPFELAILLARLSGLLRRKRWLLNDRANGVAPAAEGLSGKSARDTRRPEEDVFHFGGKTIDFAALQIRVADRTVQLTLMEANLFAIW